MNIKLRLNLLYYGLFVLYCGLIGLMGYYIPREVYMSIPWELMLFPKSAIQGFVILYMLASIPGTLYGFKKKMATVSKMENEEARKAEYLKWARIRILLIGAGAAMGIFAFYALQDQSMLWCAGICLLAQYFCKPTEKKIYMEMNDIREDDPRMGDIQ